MPTAIFEIVTNQIQTLYTPRGKAHIDTVADSLAMSKRTLQREIAGRGTSYDRASPSAFRRQAVSA